jgi:REP element-mobilizing transposase RayT
LTGQIAQRLKEILQGVATETESEILEVEVMPDHIHLLCEVDPQFGIAKFVRLCKVRSVLQRAFLSPFTSGIPHTENPSANPVDKFVVLLNSR